MLVIFSVLSAKRHRSATTSSKAGPLEPTHHSWVEMISQLCRKPPGVSLDLQPHHPGTSHCRSVQPLCSLGRGTWWHHKEVRHQGRLSAQRGSCHLSLSERSPCLREGSQGLRKGLSTDRSTLVSHSTFSQFLRKLAKWGICCSVRQRY